MATKIPSEFRKLVCVKTTPKFRDAVSVVSVPTPTPGPGQVLVRTRYAGINASDVNATAGRYESAPKQLPFDLGFESVGEVVAVGPDVQGLKVNEPARQARRRVRISRPALRERSFFYQRSKVHKRR